MAKKTSSEGQVTESPKPRKAKVVSAAAQELLTEASNQIAAAKSQAKEAKAIGKIIECVSKLNRWGLGKVRQALDTRATEIEMASQSGATNDQ